MSTSQLNDKHPEMSFSICHCPQGLTTYYATRPASFNSAIFSFFLFLLNKIQGGTIRAYALCRWLFVVFVFVLFFAMVPEHFLLVREEKKKRKKVYVVKMVAIFMYVYRYDNLFKQLKNKWSLVLLADSLKFFANYSVVVVKHKMWTLFIELWVLGFRNPLQNIESSNKSGLLNGKISHLELMWNIFVMKLHIDMQWYTIHMLTIC